MDFKKKQIKVDKTSDKTKLSDMQIQIEIEKEKTRQLELIKEIKKMEFKMRNNKKYKHQKKYIDLASILNDEKSDNDNDNESSDHNYINDIHDTISLLSTHSIDTIDYINRND